MDFNSEGTITTPSYEVEKILILEKRENTILGMGFHHRQKAEDASDEALDRAKGILKSRMWELFLQVESWVEEAGGKYKTTEEPLAAWMRKQLEKPETSFKELDLIMQELSRFLFKGGLTKINVRSQYNKGRVEVENERRRI